MRNCPRSAPPPGPRRHPPGALRAAGVLLLGLAFVPACSPSAAGDSVRLLEVYDGDTVRVELAGGAEATVRLIGVDAPEVEGTYRHAELGGEAAAAFARDLMKPGPVTLEADPTGDDVDPYRRLLRYVRLPDGRDAGAEILAAGYASAYRRFHYTRREAYQALEAKAKGGKRGLWGVARGGG